MMSKVGVPAASHAWLRLRSLCCVALVWMVASVGAAAQDEQLQPVEIRPAFGESAKVEVIAVEGKGWLERRAGQRVLHLAGTPFEMGRQHGVLAREEVRGLVKRVMNLAQLQALKDPEHPIIPKLQEAVKRCMPFMLPEHVEELKGLADGSGVPLDMVHLANMIPELFHCSGFALWGKATTDGALVHGRILDYAMEIGYQQFAAIIVAHPEGRLAYVNVGYTGFLGSVTGTNEKQVSFGEMGGRGEGQWDGMPMAFLMRKGLENANTLDEAVAIFRDTPRTCEYYYVVSDAKIPSARGLACWPKEFIVLNPGEAHPKLPVPLGILDTVLMSGDDRFQRLASRVLFRYGAIDPSVGLQLMRRPVAMKSALHTALFAPAQGKMWVSNAIDQTPSSECPYTEYDLKELFAATTPPSAPVGKAERDEPVSVPVPEGAAQAGTPAK